MCLGIGQGCCSHWQDSSLVPQMYMLFSYLELHPSSNCAVSKQVSRRHVSVRNQLSALSRLLWEMTLCSGDSWISRALADNALRLRVEFESVRLRCCRKQSSELGQGCGVAPHYSYNEPEEGLFCIWSSSTYIKIQEDLWKMQHTFTKDVFSFRGMWRLMQHFSLQGKW